MLEPTIQEAKVLMSGMGARTSRMLDALHLGDGNNGSDSRTWTPFQTEKKSGTPLPGGEEAEPTAKAGVLESLLGDGKALESGTLRVAAFLRRIVGSKKLHRSGNENKPALRGGTTPECAGWIATGPDPVGGCFLRARGDVSG